MAIIRETQYPGLWNLPSVNSPQGNFKNETALNAEDGSYLDSVWKNDEDALIQSLLIAAGVTPNGNPDEGGNSQVYKALVEQCMGRAQSVTESAGSVADAYVFEESANNQSPAAIFHGMTLQLTVASTNATTTPTINAFGLGAKTVGNMDGTALAVGQFRQSVIHTVIYDAIPQAWLLVDRFEFDNRISGLGRNGFSESVGLTIDSIKKNSKSYYSAAIPGVTTVITDGVLTVTMGDNIAGGGMQEYLITDPASPQLGFSYVRFLDAGGSWDAVWKISNVPVSPVSGFDVGLRDSLLAEPAATRVICNDTNITMYTDTTVGPTGSGATFISTEMDIIPLSAKHLIFSALMYGTHSVVGGVVASHLTCYAANDLSTTGDTSQIFQTLNYIGSSSHQSRQIENYATVPLDANNVFIVNWGSQYDSTQSIVLHLKGWKE